jgi:hypothetical protein
MTTYFVFPSWFSVSVFFHDIARLCAPLISIAVVIAVGFLILGVLKRV